MAYNTVSRGNKLFYSIRLRDIHPWVIHPGILAPYYDILRTLNIGNESLELGVLLRCLGTYALTWIADREAIFSESQIESIESSQAQLEGVELFTQFERSVQ